MPNFPTALAAALAARGLTPARAAWQIAGGNKTAYKAAWRRLNRCTSPDNLPESLALLEADLKALGLQLSISEVKEPRP